MEEYKHIHTGSKLSCKFNVKDKAPLEKQHDLICRAVYAINNCIKDYVGETARCIVERAKYHNGRDQYSQSVKHPNYLPVVNDGFTILDS